jgi:hypothetical protein
VTSGLRDKKKQAEVMWKYWEKTLKRGQIYVALRSDTKLLKQLDEWYEKGDKESEISFKSQIEKIASSLSRHLTGQAVDVSTSVDKNVFTVLKAHMAFVHETNREGETTCYHFDDRKMPPPVVTDAIKAKWPKA